MKHLPILVVISLFIPVVGFIIYYFLKDTLENDIKARAAILTYHTSIVIIVLSLIIKINPNI